MSTKMNEANWELALDVFRTCLPARGARAKNDRLFLKALHHSQHHLAGAAGTVRHMELCLETVRPARQSGRVRGLLRHAGRAERYGAPGADVR